MVRLYLLTVSWHFVAQARGILRIYCRKRRYEQTPFQRMVWDAMLHLTMINWMLVQLSDYFGNKGEIFLLQKLPAIIIFPRALVDVLAWAILALAVVALSELAWRWRRFLSACSLVIWLWTRSFGGSETNDFMQSTW
jgi:hypothetical protein